MIQDAFDKYMAIINDTTWDDSVPWQDEPWDDEIDYDDEIDDDDDLDDVDADNHKENRDFTDADVDDKEDTYNSLDD